MVENANQERGDLALEGTARVLGDELRLEGFWLGDSRYNRGGRSCAYVFTRRK